MVAHIDPGKRTGVLVSFPRDLWVAIPGHGTPKINAAFAYGGAQLTIETIEQDFDIPISHYLEVDFAGFRDIVNAIGSVPIYFPTPARDIKSGLAIATRRVPAPQRRPGARVRALALLPVRCRTAQWQYDPTSDLGRIQRQQYFLRSLSQRRDQDGVLAPVARQQGARQDGGEPHPRQAARRVAISARSCSRSATPTRTRSRCRRCRRPPSFVDRQSVLLLDDGAGRADARPAARHATREQDAGAQDRGRRRCRLTVRERLGRHRRREAGARAGSRTDGFRIGAPAADADRSDYAVTEVRYAPGAETKAQLRARVPRRRGQGGRARLGAPSGVDVVVVLGQDFHQVTIPTAGTTVAPTTAPSPPSLVTRCRRPRRRRPARRPIRAVRCRSPAASRAPVSRRNSCVGITSSASREPVSTA